MKKEMKKRAVLVIVCLGLWFFVVENMHFAEAKDPDYPNQPINFILTFTPGGTTDTIGRALTTAAQAYLGQPFVPINRPGGGGAVGTLAIMNAKPDGYTVGIAGPSPFFATPFQEEPPYGDLSGLTSISNFTMYIQMVAVKGDSPWKKWEDFINWARKNPGEAKIGITGAPKSVGLGRVMLHIEEQEKVKFTYVPFKGSPETMTALLGGHVSVFLSTTDPTIVSYLQEGKMRILLYLSSYKLPGFENAPTSKDLYGLLSPNLCGVCGPRGLPDYVVKRLDGAFAKAVKDPNYIKAMKTMNWPDVYMNSKDMTNYVEKTFQEYKEIIRKQDAK